ncbi:hypothetical protein RB625_33500, partial [Streptomyces californicus]|uniref:hypothetical protein n=1 Tax=Streptomyces californicus TaxID=67351 RepID=UPI00296F5E4A
PSGQEKNPYLYAEGDPVNLIDPSGLAACDNSVLKATLGAGVCADKETKKKINKKTQWVAASASACAVIPSPATPVCGAVSAGAGIIVVATSE